MQVAGIQTMSWPHAQQILPRWPRSVSSAPPETITFSRRDFFLLVRAPYPSALFTNLTKVQRERGGGYGGGEIPLDKARPLINFQRPTPFAQLPDGKVQGSGPHLPLAGLCGSISSSLALQLCAHGISTQLNLWKQMAHDVPSDKIPVCANTLTSCRLPSWAMTQQKQKY